MHPSVPPPKAKPPHSISLQQRYHPKFQTPRRSTCQNTVATYALLMTDSPSHSVVFRILTLTAHSTALFPYCILAASPPISSTGSQRAHLRCHGAIDNPVQCAGQVQDGQGDKRPAWPCHHPEAVSGSLHLRNPHLYMPYKEAHLPFLVDTPAPINIIQILSNSYALAFTLSGFVH